MKFKHVIGLDIAKSSIEVRIHAHAFAYTAVNNPQGLKTMLTHVEKALGVSLTQCLCCFEHTGLYSERLMELLSQRQIPFAVVSGLEIKKSRGLTRGKSDPIDARQIAEYAYSKQHRLRLYRNPSPDIKRVKRLLTLREQLVKQRASFKTTLKEQSQILKKTENATLLAVQKRMINKLSNEIDHVEQEYRRIIVSDPETKTLVSLLASVIGVGEVISNYMVVYTHGFTAFTCWRKFACFIGTAPFPHRSGTSIKGRDKVSSLAHKRLKTLIHLAAQCAVRCDPELRTYYQKRLQQGKSKMSTLNIVRNKLLARMFSVVQRRTPYVVLNRFAA